MSFFCPTVQPTASQSLALSRPPIFKCKHMTASSTNSAPTKIVEPSLAKGGVNCLLLIHRPGEICRGGREGGGEGRREVGRCGTVGGERAQCRPLCSRCGGEVFRAYLAS